MSPVSRGRKTKRKMNATRRPSRASGLSVLDGCGCPECSGVSLERPELIDFLVTAADDLVRSADPLDAEVVGASFMALGAVTDDGLVEASMDMLISEFEARPHPGALAMLLAIGSVADGDVGRRASAAADRLARTGVPRPNWVDEVCQPVTVSGCRHLTDPDGTGSILACTFSRAGRSHAMVVTADHENCGAAEDILLLDVEHLPAVLDRIRSNARSNGVELTSRAVGPAEFRRRVEEALDARTVHDGALVDDEAYELPTPEDGPCFPTLAVLMRKRMRALPAPVKPRARHGAADHDGPQTAVQMLAQFVASLDAGGQRRPAVAPLPAKRRTSGPPAPVYQIKVSLRGAKPPIWRRLEVPADITLAELHDVIQIAFGWDDYHLHVFETPYGSFGIEDTDLGHRADADVTLEQVAPAARDKLRYTYDFGDDWDHDIVVEKVLDPAGKAPTPRCTGGRRAAPPEDCGGIMGYTELVDVLRDPDDSEHQDRLEWLGLVDATEFDPESFDAAAVNQVLSLV